MPFSIGFEYPQILISARGLGGLPPKRKRISCIAGEPVRSLSRADLLEKEYPSILAWRIPWTEEPGGLQSMGSTRLSN